ncbi:MAG: hypothetical protein IPG08_04275 [Sphingobacteriaceae bacterium]|nr:hypothetical protein [Sphingobacteriaceae bacterium]
MLNRIYIRRIVFISFLHFLLSITVAFAQKSGTSAKPTKTVAKETEALEWHTDLFKVYDISKRSKNLFSLSLPEAIGVAGVKNCKPMCLQNLSSSLGLVKT